MGHYNLFLSVIFTTLVALSTGSKSTDGGNRILVKIDATDVQVTCSIDTDGLPLKNFAWFECPNMEQMKECREDRDKYRKAWIKNGTVINDNPDDYKLSEDRTLSILKISPKYDGAVFLCIGEIEYHEALENTNYSNNQREARHQDKKSTTVLGDRGIDSALKLRRNGFSSSPGDLGSNS